MSSTSSKNITCDHMRIFTYVLMIFLFVLPHTNANNFNKLLVEAKALTDWWGRNASDHCTWYGITCNEAGSVISIELKCNYGYGPHDLGSLDFSSFPNRERFIINRCPLEGSIPEQIGMLSNLAHLSLAWNILNGTLPVSITNLTKLVELDLSGNNFTSSTIPFQIGNLKNLLHLNLNHNQFTGLIASSLGSMVNLTYLDLSHNQFNGPIPSSLGSMVYLTYLDLLATKDKIEVQTTKNGDVCSILNYDGTIAYEDFISATEDFDLKYCVGTGGYGSVYEAKLPNGKIFALKKLHRFEAEQPTFNQSFKNEVQVLTNLRHKNIVKLYGFCLHKKCNFLVYEYLEKGSLFCALSDDELTVKVDWMMRLNIIKDVARALAYMHWFGLESKGE
ncbi:MDIS1-interacting receptor like kinase 2-like protein [Tanacetum coccineum]